MSKRLLDYNPLTGESTWFTANSDGTISLTKEQDVTSIIEMNKAIANEDDITKAGIKKGWWKYASIPNIFVEKWSREVGGNILHKQYEKELFKRINSPDFRYFRTTHKYHQPKG